MSDTQTEAVTPEVLEPQTGEVVPMPTSRSAIERAAEAALELPNIVGRDEFLMLAAQARMLSMSGAAPKAVRGNPHLAFHVALIGRDLRISPSAALRLIDVIELRKPSRTDPGEFQLSLSPELINGVLIREGMGRIIPLVENPYECQAQALDATGAPLGPPTVFTWQDAQRAGLVGAECSPDEHKISERTGTRDDGSTWTSKRCGCNQGYITYPSTMLWWRACAFSARRYFPQSTLGIYTTEELGAPLDEQGRMIDPATVELPEGFMPPERPPDPASVVDVERTWGLQARIYALPDQQRGDLRDRWKKSRLSGKVPMSVTDDLIQFAESMVASFERMAVKTGWDAEAALAEVHDRCAASLPLLLGVPAAPPVETPAAPDPVEAPAAADGESGPAEGTTAPDAGEPDPRLAVIDSVKALSAVELDAELEAHSLSTKGSDAQRRRRLAEKLFDERPFA